jgi:hypothetical protein
MYGEGDLVELIFCELRPLGSCRSRSDFSVDWLGTNDAYYRSVVARDEAISIQAQAHLAATLRNIGWAFAKSEFPQLRDKGAAMISMHGLVLEDLFERVTLDAVRFETE